MKEITEQIDAKAERCVSCGAKMKGNYCHKCGEKKIIPERDFSLFKFLKQTLGHFVHFDSKLLRTCWLLFSKPGFLSAEWIAGRRVNYMKPLQLFVVAGLLFYFFLPNATAYFSSYQELGMAYRQRNLVLNTFHYNSEKALTEKAAALQIDETELSSRITTGASQKSKTWLFLLVPVWGAILYFFFLRQLPWLVPQIIFALHGLTFYILTDLLLHAIFTMAGINNSGKYLAFILLLILSGYQAKLIRRYYGSPWPLTILKTIGVVAGFVILMSLYRQIITIVTITTL